MKNIRQGLIHLSIVVILIMLSISCTTSRSGGGSSDGVFSTTWDILIYQGWKMTDSGSVTIDGAGNLSGEIGGKGSVGGDVDVNGRSAIWTPSYSFNASGAFYGDPGTGAGEWTDRGGNWGTWRAFRR